MTVISDEKAREVLDKVSMCVAAAIIAFQVMDGEKSDTILKEASCDICAEVFSTLDLIPREIADKLS